MENLKMQDIAGYEEEKRELMQVVAMFRDFKKYSEHGVYLSKGLIISGDPGVGKTLFAKVLANEIDAPFIYVDGSEYAGTGGVRKLKAVFAKARRNSPSIVFIDELNTFVGGSYKSDNTKRNLSTLLKLIDGIKSNDGVFVIGATSDKYDLDEALYRSGRMDKHICLNSPNFDSRRAIFEYYLSKVNLDVNEVNIRLIAEKTQGFSGADLKTLVNETMQECIYKSVQPNDDLFLQHIRKIEEQDIIREKDNRDLSLLAFHDLGHMVVSRELLSRFDDVSLLYDTNRIGNSSISSLFSEQEDDDDDEESVNVNTYDSASKLLDKVCVLLGGAAAEEVFCGERFMTSEPDFELAVKLINASFSNGMEGFEYVNLDTYYYIEISQELLRRMEVRRAELLKEQYDNAKNILAANRNQILELHAILLKKRFLSIAEISDLFNRSY